MLNRPMIIAEAGVNHNGDIELAKRLIDAAADAGADLVKFQTFNSDELVSKNAPKADYQIPTTGNFQSQLAMLRQLVEMHETLFAHCGDRAIEFFSSGLISNSIT